MCLTIRAKGLKYFLRMVLSRSRYKYVLFSKEPFTSHTSIDAHEKTFGFLEGIPDTLVYDQGRVFMVDENNGDLILTDAFKSYQQQRGFRLHFCRKSDPQSKGKVENLVKYVKQNLLYNRTFVDIDLLNSEALA
jgi:transposase